MTFDLDKINNLEDLKNIKNEFNNSNELISLVNLLKDKNVQNKAEIGKKIQALKEEANLFFEKAKTKLNQLEANKIMENEFEDFSFPHTLYGSIHPIEIIANRFRK